MKTLEQLAREAGMVTFFDMGAGSCAFCEGVDGVTQESLARFRAACRAEALEEAAQWQPIETAPRGSGMDGPGDTRHPDYVQPPKVLLWTREGPLVGYYDWYYHPGYGRGADPDESVWRDHEGGRTYGVTHWMPLPQPPAIREMK